MLGYMWLAVIQKEVPFSLLYPFCRPLYPSLCPVASVQIAVADGLGDVHGRNLVRTGEVGYVFLSFSKMLFSKFSNIFKSSASAS